SESELHLRFGLDEVGNVVKWQAPLGETPEERETYAYDDLYRLTGVHAADGSLIEAFGYDAIGNRAYHQKPALPVGDGGSIVTEAYSYGNDSHRLQAINGVSRSYDAVGNTTHLTNDSGSTLTLTYSDA